MLPPPTIKQERQHSTVMKNSESDRLEVILSSATVCCCVCFCLSSLTCRVSTVIKVAASQACGDVEMN